VIPFQEMGDALLVARSMEELEAHVLSGPGPWLTEDRELARSREIEKQLGPFDGRASDRCMRLIERCVSEHTEQAEEAAHAGRRALDADAPAHCRRTLRSARRALVLWRLVGFLLPALLPAWQTARRLLGETGPTVFRGTVAEHLRSAHEQIARCWAVLDRAGEPGRAGTASGR
jgi:hypothetical protein